MQLALPGAEIFVPDSIPIEDAFSRTTHLGIGAHQDDLEVMAYHGILECFGRAGKWFAGAIVTEGAGSPRCGSYSNFTDEEMRRVRRDEQKKAAVIGEYSAQVLLDYPSSAVRDPDNSNVVDDIKRIVLAASPEIVYTHNPADKHDTHVAVALRVIRAIRDLPPDARPECLYGCETWRDLDWLHDDDKIALDVAGNDSLEVALLEVFDSQICAKRYDLATIGRRRAHATYHSSHETDETTRLIFAMDLTPLIQDVDIPIESYMHHLVNHFADDVASRIRRQE